ncbi:MAG: hypothetical protein E4H39_00255 [Syntrophobacterales bacterium]|nr:MAG: hypothetical protein E4H39_00255 [Syntrophobacterales bacterium]
MSDDHNRGIIDATNRIMGVLLKSPTFKSNVKSVLNSIDPDNARELARTILWEDPEIVLSLMGAVPSLANSMIRFLDEIILQVREKFSPELLHDFLGTILQDVDRETIRRIKLNLTNMLDEVDLNDGSEGSYKGEKE